MKYQLIKAAITDKGAVRTDNEDIYYANSNNGIFFISDGMGGNLGGKLASKTVYEKLPQLIKTHLLNKTLSQPEIEKVITKILNEVNKEIHKFADAQKSLKKIGATVALLFIQNNNAIISHLGDSRIYLCRNNKLKRLTKDHSVIQTLVDSGNLKEKDIHKHPAKGNLLKSLGGADKVFPNTQTIEIKNGDRFLLTSDGVTDIISDFELETLLNRKESVSKICKDLFNETIKAGAPDNVTSVFLEIGEKQTSFSIDKIAISFIAILVILFSIIYFTNSSSDDNKPNKTSYIKVLKQEKINHIYEKITKILKKKATYQSKEVIDKNVKFLESNLTDKDSLKKLNNLKILFNAWWDNRARKVAITNIQIMQPLTESNLNGVTENILISKLELHFSKYENCELVERNELKKAMNELKFNSSNLINQATAMSIGKLTAAEFVVSGKIYKLSDKITISIKMLNVSTGEIASIAEISINDKKEFSNNEIYSSLTKEIINNSILKKCSTENQTKSNNINK